jgi:hypothetical protein
MSSKPWNTGSPRTAATEMTIRKLAVVAQPSTGDLIGSYCYDALVALLGAWNVAADAGRDADRVDLERALSVLSLLGRRMEQRP